jgi:hypothetical protein
MNESKSKLRWPLMALVGATITIPVAAFSAEEGIGKLAEKLIDLRGEVESLHDEIESKQQDHRNRMSSLSQRRAELEAQIQRQELDIEKVRRQIAELREKAEDVDDESAALQPVATGSARRLEEHVSSSLPFTVDERLAEIEEIRSKLSKGEVSAPRALNQLWTFVEDELRLSKENGLFRQTIMLDDEEQLADVVRVGMVMLFFRTGDGRYGHAERSDDGWAYVVVDGQSAEDVEILFEDFEKQVRTGFFEIPNALPEANR